MPRNAITLVKRKAGGIEYWDARWHDHAVGKRRGKSLGRCDQISLRQARKMLGQLELEFEEDPHARSPGSVPTIGQWIDMLIQRKEAAGRKPKTIADYRTVEKMLNHHFGADHELNTIKKFDIEQFRLRLSRHELHGVLRLKNKRRANATSVTKYMRLVSAIFTAAYDDELIIRNPARKLGLDQSPASSWNKVSSEVFWKLYENADSGLKILLALCRLAALRKSDAMALKWGNVRFDEGVLVFRPLKVERFAKKDARVPICTELRKILEEAHQASFRIDGFVVDQKLPIMVSKRFVKICGDAGIIPWAKPLHTLRKSCIDDWARIAPPNVVMEWATHTALSTTMRYYTKVDKADEQIGQGSLLPKQSAAVAQAV